MGMTMALTMVSMLYFGILLLFGSGAQLVEVFRSEGWKGRIWHVLIAVLYLIAGIIVVSNPALASATLTVLIASSLIAIGVLRLVIAIQMRGIQGWVWTLLGSVVTCGGSERDGVEVSGRRLACFQAAGGIGRSGNRCADR
jgi:uncharacterized membrane protein HdeD (DUF308 family)